RLLLLLELFDALDEGLEMILGESGRGFLDGGSSGGHRALLDMIGDLGSTFPDVRRSGQGAAPLIHRRDPLIHRSAQAKKKERGCGVPRSFARKSEPIATDRADNARP